MGKTKNVVRLAFNRSLPKVMHIDLNSCFATIEQQANPLLRGKPVAVAAYAALSGCIISPSVEAKKVGIRVGMRVKEGKIICPGLVVLSPDPWKYRNIHLKLRRIFYGYTGNVSPKSIDDFFLDFRKSFYLRQDMKTVAGEIKSRIKKEAGEWLTVSVGIAPNRFLAKVASGLHKPDGLDEINALNFRKVYRSLGLTDLYGIKTGNAARLAGVGVYSVEDFYRARIWQLKAAFCSIAWYYWYLRLRGWEVDDIDFTRKSFGNSYTLPGHVTSSREVSCILARLAAKTGFRLRNAGYRAKGVRVAVLYRDWSFWHKSVTFERVVFDSRDIYKRAYEIFCASPWKKPVKELAVSCFGLSSLWEIQLSLFTDIEKEERLTRAADRVNRRWGDFVLTYAKTLGVKDRIPDRISFGGVEELKDFVTEP